MSPAAAIPASHPRRQPLRLLRIFSRAATIARHRRRAPAVPT